MIQSESEEFIYEKKRQWRIELLTSEWSDNFPWSTKTFRE